MASERSATDPAANDATGGHAGPAGRAPRAASRATARVSVEEAVEEIRAGRPLIVTDDEDRENEGDIVVAAQFCTPELVNFMATHARGLICVPLPEDWADRLDLQPMTDQNNAPLGTAFTVTVEAAEGVTTGISAQDRSTTIRKLADPDAAPHDFTRPGHIFPLRAKPGGVLVRAGQTEASVDLCRLAGIEPVAVVCEVMKEDGSMARMPDLEEFAEKHDLKIVTVADIISYRLAHERLVERIEEVAMPTRFGEFRAIGYRTYIDSKEHVVLTMGDVASSEPVLVRMHDQCVTGDVFGSLRCDCGEQLDAALSRIAEEGRGVGLHNKLRAYKLQEAGLDTVEANEALGLPAENREYGIGAQILVDLGVRRLRLMTNNPVKIQELDAFGQLRGAGLDGYGIEIVERVPLEVTVNAHNVRYMATKRDKMGHWLDQEMPGLEG